MSGPGFEQLATPAGKMLKQLIGQRDVIGASVLSVLVKMCRDMTRRDGWDQPVRLFTLRRMMAEPRAVEEALGVRGELLLLSATEIGDAIFGYADGDTITRGLRVLANSTDDPEFAVMRQLNEQDPDQLIGWLLANEAYVAITDQPIEGQVKDQPGRLEIRQLLCADTAGTVYQVMQHRDTGKVYVWLDNGSGPEGYRLGGQITEALREVAATFA